MQSKVESAAWDYMKDKFHLSETVFGAGDVIHGFEDGANWEANRPDSKSAKLWQTLTGLRNAIITDPILAMNIAPQVLSLVDQCLIENKPEIL